MLFFIICKVDLPEYVLRRLSGCAQVANKKDTVMPCNMFFSVALGLHPLPCVNVLQVLLSLLPETGKVLEF